MPHVPLTGTSSSVRYDFLGLAFASSRDHFVADGPGAAVGAGGVCVKGSVTVISSPSFSFAALILALERRVLSVLAAWAAVDVVVDMGVLILVLVVVAD